MRSNQCEVERGTREVPAAGVVKDARETLDEDKAVKEKVRKQVALNSQQSPSASALHLQPLHRKPGRASLT